MTARAEAAMPRLSEILTGPVLRWRCQSCGLAGAPPTMEWWQEHDDADRPEPIVLSLCWVCAPKLIPPHPRLYRQLMPNEPMPGALDFCEACVHRDIRAGQRCAHPAAKINGGPGLTITIQKPMVGFVDYRGRDGKRAGGPMKIWGKSATACSGQEVAP